MRENIHGMEKEEIKKPAETCVEASAEAKVVDLRVLGVVGDEAGGTLVFDVGSGHDWDLGTAICARLRALGGDIDEVELGKTIMTEIWGNAKAAKRLKAKLFEDALVLAAEKLRERRGSASAKKTASSDPNGDRLRETLERWRYGLPVSWPLKK